MLEYKIDGPALRSGTPIHIAASALDHFQVVLDKTYLVAVGSKRMSARDRDYFQLKASSFSHGSFKTIFDIALSGVQLTLPFIGNLGPQNIWKFTTETFNFLKVVCDAVQNDVKPKYEFHNKGDVTVHTGDIVNHYHGPVVNIAELSLPAYQNLAHLIDGKNIDFLSAKPTEQKEPDIFLGKMDKDIFDIPTRIDKDEMQLLCEIFDFNKYKNVGKLSVKLLGQAVKPGEYNFTIFGSQDHVDYIYSMLKPEVGLKCMIEMESNPFGEDKVHKLHITGVNS